MPPRHGTAPAGLARSLVVVLALAACSAAPSPTPAPTPTVTPSPSPSPTPVPPVAFPLAVVTGITNLQATITLDELGKLASGGLLVVPCGVAVTQPTITATAPCVAADQIAADLRARQDLVALIPPGLVEPATKVLSIAGTGPFGLFGPDLFGDPQARALPYPVMGSAPADGPGALDPAWTVYAAAQTWTLTSIGSLCADRVAAHQAITLGKGWDWVFNGGTASYKGKAFLNPNPPAGISRFPIVLPVETGNDGVTASISKRSDVALADQKCPILATNDWKPSPYGGPGIAVPEEVLTRWKDFLGIDAVYLAADHQSDRGVAGIRSTVQLLDKDGFPHTGVGLNLDQALEPAYVQVAGLKVAFLSWNEVVGPTHAGPTTPGVAWLTEANVNAAMGKARAAGADLVICDPQWWGGDEYHPDLRPTQQTALGWMDKAGCDQVIAGGLHIAGGMFLRKHPNGVSLVDAGPGNYMYGQPWWQQTQEGVILVMTFRGKTLVNVRLHPYVMVLSARASLTDPEGDGHYVLQRIWKAAEVNY